MTAVPPNALFSALSFIGFVLAALPLPWHLRLWNTGTCLYMLWTSIGCLILFVNSIVWSNNVINWAPVWCDISSRYIIGASVGIPASSLCIIRRLYYIISAPPIMTQKNKWTPAVMIDLSIGVGLPFLVMALEYVVEGQRFVILEEIGCFPFTVNTIETYFLVYMWPLFLGLISLVYAALTFRLTRQQKAQLEKMLYTNCSISVGRYWRLMALCATEIIFTVPMSIYSIVINTFATPPIPYNWAAIHTGFSVVSQVPSFVWRSSPLMAAGLEITRWSFVLCAFVIFAYFGWAEEAREYYRRVYWFIARRFGYSKSIQSLPSTKPQRPVTFAGNPALPLYADSEKRLSMHIQGRVQYPSSHSFNTVDIEHLEDFALTGQRRTSLTSSQNTASRNFDPKDDSHTLRLELPTIPALAFTGSRDQSRSDLNPIHLETV